MNKTASWMVVALIALVEVAGAHVAQAAVTNREPYDVAIRCVIANVVAEGQRRRAGDAAKADYYASKGKEAFRLAYGFGDHFGFTRAQVEADFDRARREELPAMMRDQPYFYRVVAQCKAYKLM